jgi:hypothetical protein
MRFECERSRRRSRWLLETTGAVDRALAAVLLALFMLVAHALGLDLEAVWRLWVL